MRFKYHLISIFLHSIIVLILYFVTCPKHDAELSEIKVEFISFSKERAVSKAPSRKEEPENIARDQEKVEKKFVKDLPDKVNNRDRMETNLEKEQIDLKEDDLLATSQNVPSKVPVTKKDNKIDGSSGIPIPSANRFKMDNETPSQSQGQEFFKIEGDLQNRVVVNKIMPEPVSGLNEEVIINFRLVVNGSGEIIEIVPVKKGNFKAEESALNALKKWKFNKLPQSEIDSLQSGIITLYFKLR